MLNDLTIDDKDIFKKYEDKKIIHGSDSNFTNLYIWEDYYRPKWQIYEDMLFVFAYPDNEEAFAFQPVGEGDLTKAISFIKQYLEKPQIKRATKDFIAKLNKSHKFEYQPDRDNDDYIYLTEQFIELRGRKMGQKRNHHNYFINNYEYESGPISPEMVPEILNFAFNLIDMKDETVRQSLEAEYLAIEKILNNIVSLEQKTWAIKINGKIEAFTVGSRLSSDMAVIHIEKANAEIRGLYVALASQMCENHFPDLTYVNREQDLGIEGLRKSKESYKPLEMLEKYTVTLI